MNDLKKIIWLASYPKSGNTWFRAFLTALLNPGQADIDINSLYDTTIASSRLLFDEMAGVPSGDLTPDEIDLLRPLVYGENARESNEIVYHKTHDSWYVLPNGSPMFPPEFTKGAIYFIRNPLDVAVSFANHLNTSIDRTIEIMNDSGYAFCEKSGRLHNQLRQKLDTWSGHAGSWIDESGLPLLVMRYEDMKNSPVESFSEAVRFIGIACEPGQVEKALERSSFDELRKQEEQKGFGEKSANSPAFFRKGIVGDWKNTLTADQVQRIISAHGKMMKRFGYIE